MRWLGTGGCRGVSTLRRIAIGLSDQTSEFHTNVNDFAPSCVEADFRRESFYSLEVGEIFEALLICFVGTSLVSFWLLFTEGK